LLGALLDSFQGKLASNGLDTNIETFFDHVIFCTNVTYSDGTFKGGLCYRSLSYYLITYPWIEFTQKGLDEADLAQLKTQTDLANAWRELVPAFSKERIHVVPSIEHAVQFVNKARRDGEKPVDTLVTGSLLLVGGLIEVAGLTEVALKV
jgi:folylpolyglutamate synthase